VTVLAQIGVMMPVAATSSGSRAKAARMAEHASRATRVSASTVSTVSVSSSAMAAFSARALPACGRRSQTRFGYRVLGALDCPSGGSIRPYSRVNSAAVPSVDPSSAITIC
jgi:hypothetical protein